jgi:hypothetical protein
MQPGHGEINAKSLSTALITRRKLLTLPCSKQLNGGKVSVWLPIMAGSKCQYDIAIVRICKVV